MQCWIYKSKKHPFTYIYLTKPDNFDILPENVLSYFGEPELVMELDLSSKEKLASVDINNVKSLLKENKFYIQLPPGEEQLNN